MIIVLIFSLFFDFGELSFCVVEGVSVEEAEGKIDTSLI